MLTGKVERGTILGEIAEFGSQFMSFGMSFTARQLEAIYIFSSLAQSRGGKITRGSGYFAAMADTADDRRGGLHPDPERVETARILTT